MSLFKEPSDLVSPNFSRFLQIPRGLVWQFQKLFYWHPVYMTAYEPPKKLSEYSARLIKLGLQPLE